MRHALWALLLVPGLCWGLDANPRYARESLGFVPPAIARQLLREPERAWKQRVAQDVSVWMGATTYSMRLMAWSRQRPGYACLAQRVGDKEARRWLDLVIKSHLREPQDVEAWDKATQEASRWPSGPAEDCRAPPKLFHR